MLSPPPVQLIMPVAVSPPGPLTVVHQAPLRTHENTMQSAECGEDSSSHTEIGTFSHTYEEATSSQASQQRVTYQPPLSAPQEAFCHAQSRSVDDLLRLHYRGQCRRSSNSVLRPTEPSRMFAFEPSGTSSLRTELEGDTKNALRIMPPFNPVDSLAFAPMSAPESHSLASEYIGPFYRQNESNNFLPYGPSPPQSATSESSSTSGFSQSPQHAQRYAFIELAGNATKKRPRRRYDEIDRLYACAWPGCAKAYGTLNHLNAHVAMQGHGPKRLPTEFKTMRLAWRKAKKDEQEASAAAVRVSRLSKRVPSPLASPSVQFPQISTDKVGFQMDVYHRSNFAAFLPRSCSYNAGFATRAESTWVPNDVPWAGPNGMMSHAAAYNDASCQGS